MWLVIAIAVALASCNEIEETKNDFYFDSADFANVELEMLQSSITTVNKSIILNGESEQLEGVKADSSIYEEMLNLLKQANINEAKFVGEYSIDTFWMLDPITSDNIEVWNYTTTNQELKVKWLQVYSNGSIKASISKENYLFSYEKEFFYEKGKSFSVISWQKTLGQDSLHLFSLLDFQ